MPVLVGQDTQSICVDSAEHALNSLFIVLPDGVELDFHKERSMLTSVPNV